MLFFPQANLRKILHISSVKKKEKKKKLYTQENITWTRPKRPTRPSASTYLFGAGFNVFVSVKSKYRSRFDVAVEMRYALSSSWIWYAAVRRTSPVLSLEAVSPEHMELFSYTS